MYSIDNDRYTCDFCGFEMEWDATDEVHGGLWGCENAERASALNALLTDTGEISIWR